MRKSKIDTNLIEPRSLQPADGKNVLTITKVVNLKLDIDGRQQKLWSYVVPNLAYPIILGKPWLEQNDVFTWQEDDFCALEIGKIDL